MMMGCGIGAYVAMKCYDGYWTRQVDHLHHEFRDAYEVDSGLWKNPVSSRLREV